MCRANYKLVYITDTDNVAYYNDLTVILPVATAILLHVLAPCRKDLVLRYRSLYWHHQIFLTLQLPWVIL